MFIETSAKAGFNIKALFRKLATALPGMEAANPVQQPVQNCTYYFVCYYCSGVIYSILLLLLLLCLLNTSHLT